MFKKRFVAVLMIAVFSIVAAGVASADGVFDQKKVKSYSQGEKAKYMAGGHLGLELSCDSCHDSVTIDDSERGVNAACINCHGGYTEVAALTAADHYNPHASHLGNINCTSCHAGHEPSVAYCANCHVFEGMEISYNFGAKPKSQKDDLSKYQKAKPTYKEQTDILIIGSGATASTAAIAAKETNPGVRIIIVEKMPISGGNSQLAAGGMNAANSMFQQKLGFKDSPDLMFLDTMKGGKYINNGLLVSILASKSAETIAWLNDKGAVMDFPGQGGGASAPRMHGPSGGAFAGPYLRDFFRSQIAEMGIDLRVNSKAVRLVSDKNGNITGAIIKGKHSGFYEINAKAVILASGGFGANPELVAKYRPELYETSTSNQPGTQGDGLYMGELVNAAMVDVKEIQVNPTLLVGSPVIVSEIVRGAGSIFVNRDGVRFISELTTRDVTSAAIFEQKGATAFIIFDEQIRSRVKQLSAAFELGKAVEAGSIEELAGKLGMDPKTLAQTVKTYNGYVDAGKDPEFNRPSLPLKLTGPVFYAIEIKPAIHYVMGGLKIDEETRVINKQGEPINGLWAAGEVTGGVHGANRLGGNSMAETIIFGRIAGINAAKSVK